MSGLEVVVASYSVARVATQACWNTWLLCEQWKNAPREVFQLRDELSSADEFFAGVQRGLGTEVSNHDCQWTDETAAELRHLLNQGHNALLQIQAIVDRLLDNEPTKKNSKREDDPISPLSRTDSGFSESWSPTSPVLTTAPTSQISPVEPLSSERIRKRRKLEWMLKTKKISSLRKTLHDTIIRTCGSLASLNV
jgi:hypothetical protein